MKKRGPPLPAILSKPIRAYEFPAPRRAQLVQEAFEARYAALFAHYGLDRSDPRALDRLLQAVVSDRFKGMTVLYDPHGQRGRPKTGLQDRALAWRFKELQRQSVDRSKNGKAEPKAQSRRKLLREINDKAGKLRGLWGANASRPKQDRTLQNAIARGVARHEELKAQRQVAWRIMPKLSLLGHADGKPQQRRLETNPAIWAMWQVHLRRASAGIRLVSIAPTTATVIQLADRAGR